nr:LysR family transcriptional regulator [Paracoccaceae bacterium]
MVGTPGKVTLWGIEVFAAVAEERSVSAAARRLGASVSAVSQQLSNLEQALGAVLIERQVRPFALTPAG